MKVLNIRRLPDGVHARLRRRAAGNGRSMEAEAREILRRALQPADSGRAVRELQALGRKLYGGPRRRVVDELIAERRRETARDEAE